MPDLIPETAKRERLTAEGACVCGAVRVEIVVPAVWAWHDHSAASRHAQGCAYATYVGSWKSRFQILQGEAELARYEDPERGTIRSFCARCGTPVLYERPRSPKMVNIPRALFEGRTGREPRYHMYAGEQADWTYLGEALAPLKGYPGVLRERPRKKKRGLADGMF
jgi:hypothetical protein